MQLSEVMTTEVATAQPGTSLQEIAKLMAECDVGCIPIIDDNRLVGLVTDRDIVVRAISRGMDLATEQVGKIMSRDVHTATPQTSDQDASNEMARYKIRRLPIVQDGGLVGMVSLGDVVVETHDPQTCGRVLEEISSPRGPKCGLA